MRTRRILAMLVVAVVALQGLAGATVAQGPAGTWATGIQIQNQSDSAPANITIEFYWAVGTPNEGQLALTFNDTVAAGQSKTYYVPSHIPGLPDNFVGSAVVESDQPVAAILNTTNTEENVPKRLGAATGVLTPSTTVYAPYLRKAYYNRNSYIAVQNTTGETAQVTVDYKDAAGNPLPDAKETATIPAYSTKIFYQDQNANLPSGFFGSATITGSKELAVVINNANSGATAAEAGFESYNGFSPGDASTKLYLPKLTINYYNFQSGFQIQNAGTSAATMTIVYNFKGQTYSQTSPTIQPGAAWSVALNNPPKSGLPADLAGPGSAVVTSSEKMVGVVIEVNTETGFSVISNAVPDGSGTTTVLFPKFDRTYYGYNGGIQVQNIGTAATQVTATFSYPGRADVTTSPVTVQPGGSTYWYAPNVPGLTEAFGGSVVVTSTGQPIVGVYTGRNDTISGDSYTAYNGIQR